MTRASSIRCAVFYSIVCAVGVSATWTNSNFFLNSKLPKRCGQILQYLPQNKFVQWGSWPWLGVLSYDGIEKSRCICVLIHPQVVLTAVSEIIGHNTHTFNLAIRYEQLTNYFQLLFASRMMFPVITRVYQCRFLCQVTHVHFSSDDTTDLSSIALLKLERTVVISSAVQPICLWEENHNYTSQLDLQIGMMIGTDVTSNVATSNLRVFQLPVRVIGESQCKSADSSFYHRDTNNDMCFAYTKEAENCHYIGSTMIFPRLTENGIFVWYLRGIISHRIRGCGIGKYNTVLDLADIKKWIESHFKESVESSCGRRVVSYTPLVTLGEEAERGDFPWHIALYLYSMNKASLSYRCGGTLISNSIVVTAAHCVTTNNAPIAADRFTIALGKFDLNSKEPGATIKRVSRVIVHENYGYTSLQNDIALLKLAIEVSYNEYIQPICMWEEGDTKKQRVFNSVGKVPGWGTNENDELSQFLYVATIPVVDDLYCLQSHETFYSQYLSSTTLCAGNPRGNGTNVCNGDSGGGLILPITQSDQRISWYLRGIVSVSIPRADKKLCDPNYYAVYTDVAQYIGWIMNNAKK